MKAILIDDMPQALQVLRADIEDVAPDVEILDTADSVVSGAKLLLKAQPDLVFLDIQLGDGTGFDILELLPEINFKIIFTTASDEYALRAFRFAAVDYLLKPIDLDELKSAIERAQSQLETTSERLDVLKDTFRKPDELPTRMCLHTQDKIEVVDIQDVVRCESSDNYTIFYFENGKKLMVTRTLKTFEKQLEKHQFFRSHQSHLVNLQYLQSFVRTEGGYLLLKNGHQVPVSVRKRAELMEILEGL